ncbi:MAG TPA: hypothetical protein VEO01_19610 [Pseudonocardiaceae bacterium]|nr:hypothetical protein [Pseudonocardiaceae bacterium]
MADPKVPVGGATSVPKAKKTYTAPHEEVRSEATQASVDRHLHGQPTNPDGTVKS